MADPKPIALKEKIDEFRKYQKSGVYPKGYGEKFKSLQDFLNECGFAAPKRGEKGYGDFTDKKSLGAIYEFVGKYNLALQIDYIEGVEIRLTDKNDLRKIADEINKKAENVISKNKYEDNSWQSTKIRAAYKDNKIRMDKYIKDNSIYFYIRDKYPVATSLVREENDIMKEIKESDNEFARIYDNIKKMHGFKEFLLVDPSTAWFRDFFYNAITSGSESYRYADNFYVIKIHSEDKVNITEYIELYNLRGYIEIERGVRDRQKRAGIDLEQINFGVGRSDDERYTGLQNVPDARNRSGVLEIS